jgi:hypothetical protein
MFINKFPSSRKSSTISILFNTLHADVNIFLSETLVFDNKKEKGKPCGISLPSPAVTMRVASYFGKHSSSAIS